MWRRLHQGVCSDVLQAREHAQGDESLINSSILADSLRAPVYVLNISHVRDQVLHRVGTNHRNDWFLTSTEFISIFTMSFSKPSLDHCPVQESPVPCLTSRKKKIYIEKFNLAAFF